jgi:hypothetical protein
MSTSQHEKREEAHIIALVELDLHKITMHKRLCCWLNLGRPKN